jgi:hypothetical protein
MDIGSATTCCSVVGDVGQQRLKVRYQGLGQAVAGANGKASVRTAQGDEARLSCQHARHRLQHHLQQLVQLELRGERTADL